MTGTELLIEAMESFGESEPSAVIVVYVSDDGFMKYKSNINSTCMKIGMLEFAKECVTRKAFADGD
jgi:hypothetical protein